MDSKSLETLLDAKFAEQRALNERERLIDRIERKATKAGLDPDYAENLRSHLSRRADGGEDLQNTSITDHVSRLKREKKHLFEPAKNSPTTEGSPAHGTDDSGTTKLDYARPENDAAFRKKMSGWGIRVA